MLSEETIDPPVSDLGERLRRRMTRLYPLCRSISGPGLRGTLDIIGEDVDLTRVAVPTGTRVFDWTIADEWTIREAYIETLDGRRVVDFRDHNLHVVGYSAPVDAVLETTDLQAHLHSLPDHPDWIPFRTSYYSRGWGFCLSERQRQQLHEPRYRVVIDSSLEAGVMDYGELLVPGDSTDEVIISAHVCHPSLANDNLSGITVAVELAQHVRRLPQRRYSYRFLFAPGTIGALTWLCLNPAARRHIRCGLVLTGLGGPGPLVYKATRRGDEYIDRAARHVVEHLGGSVRPYSPWGYDERQFNAVGFGIPVGRLSRTPHGEYPEYHTSADNLGFVSSENLCEAFEALKAVIDVLETDVRPRNLSPFGEPQLGRHGLYPSMGGKAASDAVMSMLWVLGYADGQHSILDIAELAPGYSYRQLANAARDLARADLLSHDGTAPDG